MFRDTITEKDLARGYSISECNSKMGNIPSISTMPGSGPIVLKESGKYVADVSGTCSGCCNECMGNCYAVNMVKYRRTVAKSWARNTKLAYNNPTSFADAIYRYCAVYEPKFFRVHVGGEFYSKRQLQDVFAACENLIAFGCWTRVFMYTKRYKWVEDYISMAGGLPVNVTVLFSQWGEAVPNKYNLPEFWYDDGTTSGLDNIEHCPAIDKQGHKTGIKCSSCRKCMNAKAGDKLAVYAH